VLRVSGEDRKEGCSRSDSSAKRKGRRKTFTFRVTQERCARELKGLCRALRIPWNKDTPEIDHHRLQREREKNVEGKVPLSGIGQRKKKT